MHVLGGAWRVPVSHTEFVRGHKIIGRDKSAASHTCLLSAFDRPWSNCPFLGFTPTPPLSFSLGPSPHLEWWQTTARRLPPTPICPSGQSLFSKLSSDHVNRGQNVWWWWTSVQMRRVETAVVCLLLRFSSCAAEAIVSQDRPYTQGCCYLLTLMSCKHQYLTQMEQFLGSLCGAKIDLVWCHFLCIFCCF